MNKTILLAACISLAFVSPAQNQSTLKTTNQKNVHVQRKNDEQERRRIRNRGKAQSDTARRMNADSTHQRVHKEQKGKN